MNARGSALPARSRSTSSLPISRHWSRSASRCRSRDRPAKSPAIRASRAPIWARPRMDDLLAINGLSAGYGEAIVLSNVSLNVAEGTATALLGRNGMGKTTLLNSVIGVTRCFGGSIRLDGRDITPLRPDLRAQAGIGWVPQE